MLVRVILGAMLLALASPANAFWDSRHRYVPECSKSTVIAHIIERFRWAETRTWHRGFVISNVHNIGETLFADYGPSHIDRRYCYGTARLSDGRQAEVVYVIEGGQGFASVTWRVEFCLPAYDPWHVYDSWCKSIRP